MTTKTIWIVALAATVALGAVLALGRRNDAAQGAGNPAATAYAPPAPAVQAAGAVQRPPVVVYKSPTCGCCGDWILHLQQAGFQVTAHDVDNVAPIKRQHGVPQPLESCHTAIIGDYVVEGHVPADAIDRLLRERPAGVAGIAVPGMPVGSPGMEGPNPQPYEILAFQREGGWSVYERR